MVVFKEWEIGIESLVGIKFQFCKIKIVLEVDGGSNSSRYKCTECHRTTLKMITMVNFLFFHKLEIILKSGGLISRLSKY